MPISANLIPYREFSDETPSGWLAGENQSILEFTYTGTDWTSYFVSASSNYITLFDAAIIPVVVGDSIRLTYADRTVVVSINRITNVGAAFTYQLYFNPPITYSQFGIIGVERWVGRNDYIAVEFRETLTGFAFYTENIKINVLGKATVDIGAAMRAFNEPQFQYDFSSFINQLQPNTQINFVCVYTAYEFGLPYSNLIPFKLHSVKGAFQILNGTSSNMIDYVPNPNHNGLAKWLTKMPKKKVWYGVPNFLSFIYSEFMTNATLNFGATSIPLDNSQGVGIHRILLDEDWFANEPCFTIGGDAVPDPPPPNPPPTRRRELSWHFMNSRNKVKLSVAENIHWVLSDAFQGIFSLGGATFKINGSALPNLAAFQIALLSTVAGDDIEIEINNQASVNSYFTDQVFYIEYGTNDTTVYPFYRQHVIEFSDARAGCDRMICLRHRVSFNPSAAAHSPMRVGIRTLPTNASSYVDFPYSLASASDITALNSALALIPDGTPYGLHFWYGWSGNYPAGTPLTSGNIDGAFQYRYLDAPYDENYFIHRSAGEDSFPLNIPELAGQAKVFDGVTTRQRITGINTSALDNKPFVFNCVFEINNVTASQTIFTTRAGNARGLEIRHAGRGIAWVLFVTNVSRGFYFPFPIKKGINNISVWFNGSGSVAGALEVSTNGWQFEPAPVALGGYVLGSPYSIENTNPTNRNQCGFGSAFADALQLPFNGKIHSVELWAGATAPQPTAMETRCFQTVGSYNGGIYNGETYDNTPPTVEFYLKYDNASGATVLNSNLTPTLTNFGSNVFNTFLI